MGWHLYEWQDRHMPGQYDRPIQPQHRVCHSEHLHRGMGGPDFIFRDVYTCSPCWRWSLPPLEAAYPGVIVSPYLSTVGPFWTSSAGAP